MRREEDRGCMSTAQRIHEFVERYTTWMKEVSACARDDAVAASLADLMKSRLVTELDQFVELEVRLRAFDRRAPEGSLFKLVGNGG